MTHDGNTQDLGPCCACGKPGPTVSTFITLPKKAPVPGTGWGCTRCSLPADGAVAVICGACLEAGAEVTEACHGYPGEGRRMAVTGLIAGTFGHNITKHPEYTT